MYYVYLLFNTETNHFYAGFSNNLKRRLEEHLGGKSISTKYKCHAWSLVYYEAYYDKKDALKREKRLKAHGSGMIELKKRLEYSIINFKNKNWGGKESLDTTKTT